MSDADRSDGGEWRAGRNAGPFHALSANGIRGVGGAGARVTRFPRTVTIFRRQMRRCASSCRWKIRRVSTRWMIFCWSTGSMRLHRPRTSAQISDISEIPVRPGRCRCQWRARQDRRVRQGVRHHGARSGGGKGLSRPRCRFVAVSIDARTLALSLRALAAECGIADREPSLRQ